MRILVAPCSFKESLTATAAAGVVARAARRLGHTVDVAPLADGGEGTLDALRGPMRLGLRKAEVSGARGEPVRARFGVRGAVAVIEAAEVVGLARLPPARRDPLRANTIGLGALVARALDAGARELIVALGGTSTVDGGAGMLHALGVRFLDARGRPLRPLPHTLASIAHVDLDGLDPRLGPGGGVHLTGLVDVRAPLLGARGARLFMAQKGARPRDIPQLERVLRWLYPREIARLPGAGAAGGLGAAIAALGGTLAPGGAMVMQAIGLRERIEAADLVVTGEGRLDAQTLQGKAVATLAEACRAAGKPLVALCGGVELDARALARAGIIALPITRGPGPLADAVARSAQDLARTAEIVLRLAGLQRPA